MTPTLPPEPQTSLEWSAWQDVVTEWQALLPDIDFNGPTADPLVAAIRVWGERLVTLRVGQDDNARLTALTDHVNQYATIRGTQQIQEDQ